MQQRPAVPADVKRHLRRESGFGCCKCGHPIYQYHHIVPYSVEAHFRPVDMMVLCPNCHDEASRGALLEPEQRSYKVAPYNVRHGFASGHLVCHQTFCAVEIGTGLLVNDGPLVCVDDSVLLALEVNVDHRLEVSLELNDPEGRSLARIEKNEWVSGDASIWDLEFAYRTLKIRHQRREISLEIDARGPVLRIRADLWKHGQHIKLSPKGIWMDGAVKDVTIDGLIFVGGRIQMNSSAGSAIQIIPNERLGEMKILNPKLENRMRDARHAWRELTGKVLPDVPTWARFD